MTNSPIVGVGSPTVEGGSIRTAGLSLLERRIDRLMQRPRLVQLGLDAASLAFGGLVLLQVAPPDFLFHCIFVLLVVQAFLFGLAPTLWRIAVASAAITAYGVAESVGAPLRVMELSEWPLMFLIAVLVAWMADRRTATARLYVALFRRASDRLLTVQEDERRRFARELHDGVGQLLTALTLHLDAAALPRRDSGERLERARQLATEALEETRQLANRLRPARLEHVGLVAAVRDLVGRAGIPADFRADPTIDEAQLDPTVATEAYRVVQEALSNVARHSGARRVVVEMAMAGEELRITVADDGCGFDPAASEAQGLGLAGMRERALLVGGALRLFSAPGQGTTVTLTVPVAGPQPATVVEWAG